MKVRRSKTTFLAFIMEKLCLQVQGQYLFASWPFGEDQVKKKSKSERRTFEQ